jgi:hypothetical protein
MRDLVADGFLKQQAKRLDRQSRFFIVIGEIMVIESGAALFIEMIGIGPGVGLIGIGLLSAIEGTRINVLSGMIKMERARAALVEEG